MTLDVGTELIAKRAGGNCQGDRDAHSPTLDLDLTHHSELDDVGTQFGVDYTCKRRPDDLL